MSGPPLIFVNPQIAVQSLATDYLIELLYPEGWPAFTDFVCFPVTVFLWFSSFLPKNKTINA